MQYIECWQAEGKMSYPRKVEASCVLASSLPVPLSFSRICFFYKKKKKKVWLVIVKTKTIMYGINEEYIFVPWQ